MTMTYLFMLFFVFWTLLRIAARAHREVNLKDPLDTIARFFFDCCWALLGTFFFHSVW